MLMIRRMENGQIDYAEIVVPSEKDYDNSVFVNCCPTSWHLNRMRAAIDIAMDDGKCSSANEQYMVMSPEDAEIHEDVCFVATEEVAADMEDEDYAAAEGETATAAEEIERQEDA